jgi:hypothetical protein
MFKVRQVNPASRFAFLRSRLGAPHAVIGKSISQVAQCDLRPEFRGKPRQAVRALPRALAATDADHNKGIEGEAVAIVHTFDVRFLFLVRQAPPVLGVPPSNQSICPVCADIVEKVGN